MAEATAAANGLPWAEIAIAVTQAFIALALVWLTWTQHSTQMRTQRALRVHEWGNECINILAEADHFSLLDPKVCGEAAYLERRTELLRRLSALVDRGRMFFENKARERFGQGRLPAYQGFRPKILDPLVASYRAIEALNQQEEPEDRKERLTEWRRYFVSLLQVEVNPEWLKKATQYSDGSGGEAGYSVDAYSEAPSKL